MDEVRRVLDSLPHRDILLYASWAMCALFVLFATFARRNFKMTVNDREVRNPFLRFIVAVVVLPFMGVVFVGVGVLLAVLGILFLSPFLTLLH